MRKMVVWGGILGGSVFVFLALTVGVLIWGVGILRERLPTWVGSGEKISKRGNDESRRDFAGGKREG